MPLLDEGTDAWAPVEAQALGDGLFRVVGSMPSDQQWEFAPGAIVHGEAKVFSDGSNGIVAARQSS
jgi:hypothetical protein